MQCNHCGKIVPNTTKICMFCNNEIDPNGHYIAPEEDLGSIDNTDYSKGINLQVVNDYIKEPTHKKTVLIGLAIAVVIIIIFIALIASAFKGGKKVDPSTYFISVLDTIYDYTDENIFSKKGHTGNATVKFTLTNVNGSSSVYTSGDYVFDAKKKYYSYKGEFDGNYSDGDIRLESSLLPFELVMDKNELNMTASDLSEKTIMSDLSVINDFLNFSEYDAEKLYSAFNDALKTTLGKMSYETSGDTINFRGNSVTVKTVSLVLDNKNMTKFNDSLIDELYDNARFVNELSSIRGETTIETKTYLSDLKRTLQYKYDSSNKDVLTITIYYNSSKIYKIEAVNKSKDTYKFQIEISTNKYYFDYFKNDKNIVSGSLSHVVTELNKVNHGEINFTFDTDNYTTDLEIKYNDDLKPTYSKSKIGETIKIDDLTDEEVNALKEKLATYYSDTSIFDTYRDLFISECSMATNCNCSKNECSCEYEDKIITCPNGQVQ